MYDLFLHSNCFFLHCVDRNVKQLQVVIVDLQEELDRLWDVLPIDTVIASIFDPRTKWFPRIPANEIKEALSVLKKVRLLLL